MVLGWSLKGLLHPGIGLVLAGRSDAECGPQAEAVTSKVLLAEPDAARTMAVLALHPSLPRFHASKPHARSRRKCGYRLDNGNLGSDRGLGAGVRATSPPKVRRPQAQGRRDSSRGRFTTSQRR